MNAQATLTRRGQITIPARIRRRLHLQPGDRLSFDDTVPFLKATPAFDVARMHKVIGCCRGHTAIGRSDHWLDETRGPVELPPRRKGRANSR